MSTTPADVRVHVGPNEHPWLATVAESVAATGARLVPPDDAEAVVWLSKRAEEGLDRMLHEGVRWVQLRSAGIERWVERGDLDDARVWTAARGIYAETVAEHALALILAALKLLHEYARAGTWDLGAKDKGRLVRGSTVAVVGAGGIGAELIRYLGPLGAHVIAVTRSGVRSTVLTSTSRPLTSTESGLEPM